MGDVHYMISETAKRVSVETHVLRYWEEELDLPIGRTEMGHRYYTEDDIQLFCCIKELKEQGMLLRELKGLIPDMIRAKQKAKASVLDNASKIVFSSKIPEQQAALAAEEFAQEVVQPEDQAAPASQSDDIQDRLGQVQILFGEVVQHVVADNNKVLQDAVCDMVTKSIVKEMDFLLQAKERQEEERYKRLDHLIRQQQTLRKESSRVSPTKRLKRLLGEA